MSDRPRCGRGGVARWSRRSRDTRARPAPAAAVRARRCAPHARLGTAVVKLYLPLSGGGIQGWALSSVTYILQYAKAIQLNTPEQLQLSPGPHTQALGLCPQLFVPIWAYADTCAIHSVDPQDGVFAAARLRPSLRTQLPAFRLKPASRVRQRHCAALTSLQAMFLSNAAALRLWTVHAA